MNFILLLSLVSVALAWSPSGSYAPGVVDCPATKKLTRPADSLSVEEQSWLDGRMPIAQANLITFLEGANMQDFDASLFVHNAKKNITIGVAFSGGGYRAMLAGAGQMAALDSRVDGANDKGLGGLLQASTYLTGLSGGTWLVGTVVLHDFASIQDVLGNSKLWNLKHTILDPYGLNIVKNGWYWTKINASLLAKQVAGFVLSITDLWGRALSWQMFGDYDNMGDTLTWSMIQEQELFTNYQMPYPIVVADGRTPNQNVINMESTIFEFTPHEMGSWDPSVYQFADLKYVGTDTTDGVPNGDCYSGFDNAGFIVGTSSSLFNAVAALLVPSWVDGIVETLLTKFAYDVTAFPEDFSLYKPNPFQGSVVGDSQSISSSDTLYLVDGGEDGQNVPLAPLIQPQRGLDIIFAYDNSRDTSTGWPDGASLVSTFERQFSHQGNGTFFPYVPDINSFRNLNLTARPAFFGCSAKNLTGLVPNKVKREQSLNATQALISDHDLPTEYDIPLIVYTANRPFSYYSNTSTAKLKYDDDEKVGMIQNGFETASRNNRTLDAEWSACVGCAIIRREEERQNIQQLEQCQKCFAQYCWNGDIDTATPGDNFSLTGQTVADDGSVHPNTPSASENLFSFALDPNQD